MIHEIGCTQGSFLVFYNVVTLKIITSFQCPNGISASLLKLQPMVQDIVCTQAFFYQNLSFKVPV